MTKASSERANFGEAFAGYFFRVIASFNGYVCHVGFLFDIKIGTATHTAAACGRIKHYVK